MKSKITGIGILAAAVMFIFGYSNVESPNPMDEIYSGVEFEMDRVVEPTFPDYAVSVVDYGAVADGFTDNSDAFNAAIVHVSEKGGGKVIVPRGMWITGPILMKSNINLEVQEGALIMFSDDYEKYPLVKTSFEGLDTYRCLSPIYGKGLENIAITGKGVIDGSGGSWRPVKKEKLTERHWNNLVKSGGYVGKNGTTWYPTEVARNADNTGNFNVPDLESKEDFEAIQEFLRPVMVSFVECKKVLFDGPTFQNSPAWNIHPLMCEDVILRNLTIRNPWFSQNGDGLDLESCKNALIYNNTFDVGDDAICIKSGKNEDGLKRNIPTENVIVKNNTVYHGHGGFVVGSETSGGIKNIHVSKCTFIGTDCGLRFKSARGRGGVIENIYISEIDMVNIAAEAIRFNLYYGGKSPLEDNSEENKLVREIKPVSRITPTFKNIFITDVVSTGAGIGAFFRGLPEMKIQNVELSNMFLEGDMGVTIIDASGVSLKNVKIAQKKGPALVVHHSDDIKLDQLNLIKGDDPVINIYGDETSNVNFTNSEIDKSWVKLGEDVTKKTVKFN